MGYYLLIGGTISGKDTMKRFIFLIVLLGVLPMITLITTSYGASEFKSHYNKGIEYYKQGKYDRAGNEFKEAIKLKPSDVYAIYGLGNTLYCKAKYDEAIKMYTKAININPDYAKVHYSLSLAYSKMGMTSEAEKQKKMFRKLSQGAKSSKGSMSHTKTSHTSKHKSIDHAPKKSLSQAPKKSLPVKSLVDTHSMHEKKTATHTTHAPTKQGHEHQRTKHQEKNVYESHKAPVTSKSTAGDDSHSIFKGYSGKKHKADKRVFTKAKNNHKIFGTFNNPLSNSKYFIQNKWHESRLNKIWICTAGYIFATQIWLGIVTFLCIIVWRIRGKA